MNLDLLRKAHTPGAPLVLGLSGGPDSMALFELLLHYRDERPFELHVAHIDHGWRKESGRESRLLEALCEKHHCPFHLRRLEHVAERDLENSGRKERLAYFAQVVEKTKSEALCLAHHGDDLAETVLKRLFETAPLERLSAFGFESFIGSLRIWRPLINFSKREIGDFGFDDPTNRDPRFLRARMREELMPKLERHFGKRVQKALARLSKRSFALDAYMQRQTKAWLGEKGLPLAIDFAGADPFEIEYVLSQRSDLCANLREELSLHIASGARHRFFELGSKKVIAHGGAFLLTESIELVWGEVGEPRAQSPWHKLWSEGGFFPIGLGRPLLVSERKKIYQMAHFKAVPAPLRPYLPANEGPLAGSCAVQPVDFRAKIV